MTDSDSDSSEDDFSLFDKSVGDRDLSGIIWSAGRLSEECQAFLDNALLPEEPLLEDNFDIWTLLDKTDRNVLIHMFEDVIPRIEYLKTTLEKSMRNKNEKRKQTAENKQ